MSELYEILRNSLDDTGLPVMDRNQFKEVTDKFGKEEFRKTLADYITKEKPPFPLKNYSKEDITKTFYKLQKVDISKHTKKTDREVMEKYDDYKYPYDIYGLGVIDTPAGVHSFINVSNYFMQDLRLACNSYGFKGPLQRWNDGDNLWGAFGPIWRGVNPGGKKGKLLSHEAYYVAFRLGTYNATQFKPLVAKIIYDMTEAKTVLDTSMGWGDRLAAFYASNATHYIGCDPNPNTFRRYKKMIAFYDKLTHGTKTVQIYRCGAENLPWDEIKDVDCAFTSPPYFSTERYNEGGQFEEEQSWAKYDTYEKWRDGFLLPVCQKSFESLSDRGVLMVNMLDPKIKNKRYHAGDDLVDSMKEHFIGQVGMRIMQRPQGRAVFSDEEGNFDHEQLQKFLKKIFIENIWYFGKDKKQDIFNHTKNGSLEEFFNE